MIPKLQESIVEFCFSEELKARSKRLNGYYQKWQHAQKEYYLATQASAKHQETQACIAAMQSTSAGAKIPRQVFLTSMSDHFSLLLEQMIYKNKDQCECPSTTTALVRFGTYSAM